MSIAQYILVNVKNAKNAEYFNYTEVTHGFMNITIFKYCTSHLHKIYFRHTTDCMST